MGAARPGLAAAVFAALVVAAMAQGGPPKEKPQLADIPLIQCQVCQLLANNAWQQVQALKAAATPSKKAGVLTETAVIECMEKLTTAWRPEGEWISKLDLVEEGDRLAVKEMGQVGKCGVECRTIEKAAERVMGEHDTDIAEVLFTGKMSQTQFSTWLCHELSGACKLEPPPLPKASRGRQPGLPFEPMRDGDQNLERVMGEMEDKGMKGSLYSRDDLLAKYGMPEGHDDTDAADSDGAANSDGEPIDWHHIQGGETYTTRTPARRVLDQVKTTTQDAAAAASSGLKAAAGMARGMWSKVRGGEEALANQDEL
ncbi:hypothetical protein ACK3TF_000897 [Chlorella vulgaris]